MNILDQIAYNELIAEYSNSISDQPAIFVGDYASYNEGHICGAWFDLSDFSDKDEFMERINEFFEELDKVAPLDSGYPREEMMFQDWQSIPERFIGESSIEPEFWEYLEAINEDPDFAEVLEAYEACIGGDYTVAQVKEAVWADLRNESGNNIDIKFGYYCKEQGLIEIPDSIEFYFDYEAYGRDCLYDFSEHNEIVFSNH